MSNVPRISNELSDEEARAQSAALIEELREQLQKAETASEQYRKQLGVLQIRLDEAVSEQGKLEDQGHEKDGKIEALNSEIREHVRQIRDLEQTYEMERNAMLQDKEQQASREEEMQASIQRLKDSLSQRDMKINADSDRNNISRSRKCASCIPTDASNTTQQASAIDPPPMETASLPPPRNSSAAPRGIIRRSFCRKTS